MSDIKGHPDDRAFEGDVHHENPQVAHEPTDANVRAITKWGIGLGIFIVAATFLVWFVFDVLVGWAGRQGLPASPLVNAQVEPQPPEPRLQASPRLDVLEMRDRENTLADTLAWTDPERGTARVPVDEAMRLMLKKGFPMRPQPVDAATATQRTLPSDSSSGRMYERRAQ
jgi:hypothetical protein